MIAVPAPRYAIDIMQTPDDAFLDKKTNLAVFYFGTTRNEVARMPIGDSFLVVTSPNPYVHPESELYPWHVARLMVDWCEFKPNAKKERGYRQIGRTLLNSWEIEHFEALLEEIICQGTP